MREWLPFRVVSTIPRFDCLVCLIPSRVVPVQVATAVVCIVVDLSQPSEVLPTLEQWISKVSGSHPYFAAAPNAVGGVRRCDLWG